ncbi:CIA30 family protein [Candidatus Uabimicrobium sp. HlEnr_7]|uniref:CIA30 family protein n=1 Tax=Candidatus Uabimicrobium helgolandensis TaxID=3095367 RepID=UPI0035584F69
MINIKYCIVVVYFLICLPTWAYSDETTVFSFRNNQEKWLTITDSFIGGASTAKSSVRDNHLVFLGNISHPQGFASIRSPQIQINPQQYQGIRMRFYGDGDYFVNLYTSTTLPAITYGCKIKAISRWQEVFIPFQKFQYMPLPFNKLKVPLQVANIQRLGFMKMSGMMQDFRLRVAWIKFVEISPRQLQAVEPQAAQSQGTALKWLENNTKDFARIIVNSHFRKFVVNDKPCTLFVLSDAAFSKVDIGYKKTIANNLYARNFFLAVHIILKKIRNPNISNSPFRSIEKTIVFQNKIIHVVDIASATFLDDYLDRFSVKDFVNYIRSLGVALYNGGDKNLCRDVYYVSLQLLYRKHRKRFPLELQKRIQEAIRGKVDPPIDKAWLFRRLIDEVFKSVE